MTTTTSSSHVHRTVDEWVAYIGDWREVRLANADLDDTDAINLAKALESNEKLTELDLSNNKITAIGAKAFAELFRINRSFGSGPDKKVCLDLRDNPLGKEGVLAIAEAVYETDRSGDCIGLDNDGLTEGEEDEFLRTPAMMGLMKKKIFQDLESKGITCEEDKTQYWEAMLKMREAAETIEKIQKKFN